MEGLNWARHVNRDKIKGLISQQNAHNTTIAAVLVELHNTTFLEY